VRVQAKISLLLLMATDTSFELAWHHFWERTGIWASPVLCSIVQWNRSQCTANEFEDLLPADVLRESYQLDRNMDVCNFFFVTYAQPREASWRVLEMLLVDCEATLRVYLTDKPSFLPDKRGVVIKLAGPMDMSVGTSECRVRALIAQVLLQGNK
jgi:hypothetical protein